MNALAPYLEETKIIIPIDNIDLPSVNNSSKVTTPEVAITELPDTPLKKNPNNMTMKRAGNRTDILQNKGKGIVGKCG